MVSRYYIFTILVFTYLCIVCDSNKLVTYTTRPSNNFMSKCITPNGNAAITWIYPLTKTDKLESRENLARTTSIAISNNGDWFQEQQHLNTFGPVLDARWNDFKTIATSGNLEFTNLNEGQAFYKKFEISISIRLNAEGHIFLCKDGNTIPVYNSYCYWIILGGWGGTKSVLRKCSRYEIPETSVSPTGNCKNSLDERHSNPLSENKWRHVTITFDNMTKSIVIRILGIEGAFLSFTDPEYDSFSQFKSIYVQSRSNNVGVWKYHKYLYYISRKLGRSLIADNIIAKYNSCCLSMYVAICENCNLILRLYNYYDQLLEEQSYRNLEDSRWQRIQFFTNKCEMSGYYKLYADIQGPLDSLEVAIQNLQLLSNCSENELNIISIGPVNKRTIPYTSCQYLLDPESSTKIDTSKDEHFNYNCPSNTFGSACISCAVLTGEEYCKEGLFCEKYNGILTCNCAAGYRGEYCGQQCKHNTYGEGCGKKCGKCKELCNHVDGNCNEECEANYEGTKCDQAVLPVTEAAPTVKLPCYSSCLISVPPKNYFGKEQPTYMEFQYKEKESKSEWIVKRESIGTLQVNLTELKVSTEYSIRVIYFKDANDYYDKDVPMQDFETSCLDITTNDVTFNTTMSTAIIQVQEGKDTCNLNKYTVSVIGAVVIRNNVNLHNNLNLVDLTAFQNYTVNIRREDYFISLGFRTLEGVPGRVNNIKVISQTDTSITLTWSEPTHKYGVIKEYRIRYQHAYYLACPSKLSETSTNDDLSQINTWTLKDLKPYSSYRIQIYALNAAHEGEASAIDGSTNAQDSLNPDAYNFSLESERRSLKINIHPNCDKIFGQYEFMFTANCSDAWCRNGTQYSTSGVIKYYYLYNLNPYTNYNLYTTISVGNHAENIPIMTFRTKEDVPNPIQGLEAYSQDEQSISLRWNPPYPPTGELSFYNFKFSYYKKWTRDPVFYDRMKPINCSIWKQMHCFTFNKIVPNEYYTIVVTAMNANISQESSETTITLTSGGKEPEPPINVNAVWDDLYNLTLEWTHPNKSNGNLKKFYIRTNKEEHEFIIADYNLTYTTRVPVIFTEFRKEISFSVGATNRYGRSRYATNKIFCPPPTPQFRNQPSITDEEMHKMTLKKPTAFMIDNNSYLLLILSSSSRNAGQTSDHDASIIKKYVHAPSKHHAWLAMELNYDVIKKSNNIILGEGSVTFSNRTKTEMFNRKLAAGTTFKINLVLVNEWNNYTRYSLYELEATTKGIAEMEIDMMDGDSGAIYLLFLLFVAPIVVICFIIKKRKVRLPMFNNLLRESNNSTTRSDTIPLTKQPVPTKSIKPDVAIKAEIRTKPKYTKLVNLRDFEDYVKESIFNGELAKQHEKFPRGAQKDCKYGRLPQNKAKNRYANLTAYDHSRVKLQKVEGDTFSDYINANYVLGFNSPHAYIATQGPKPTTVNDFWRMVWEQNVMYIVMLANVIENGKQLMLGMGSLEKRILSRCTRNIQNAKLNQVQSDIFDLTINSTWKKTEQYWPNINELVEFGDITVKHISSEIFADYENREFCVVRNMEERYVKQYHYTTWPDHGVPLYPQNLVPFLRKLIAIPQGESPVVVHCSAGVGRTGTIILIDTCLRMAAQTDTVDALYYLHQMREQRSNLVDNEEQYKLAHLVILECLVSPDTSILCDANFEESIKSVIQKDIASQLLHITNSGWQENAICENTISTRLLQPEKDRIKNITPESYGILYISPHPSSDENSTYINAVSVDAFNSPKRFIATQQPLPNTLDDFWRLVFENDVGIIISLQDVDLEDPTCCQYLPNNTNRQLSMSLMTLTFSKSENHDHYRVRTINLVSKNESRKIQVIILKKWKYGDIVPSNLSALLSVWQQMNNLAWNDNRIIVTCRDGFTGCGFYTAMCFILEKIKLEHICDVCQAVRVIRRSRKQFVQSEVQYISLYETAGQYLREFAIYSNFTVNKS